MLQRIRDRISGWIAGVVIALVAGAFMLFGVEYYFDSSAKNQNDMATVNGTDITEAQVNTTFSALQKQAISSLQGQPLTDEMTKELKNYALQSLVTQTALFTTLVHQGFRVGLSQIESMITQAPEFQDQGKFSEEKFRQALYQANMLPDQFFKQVQSRWVVGQVTNGLAASAFVLPNELSRSFALANQQRAFGYFMIPAQSFLPKTTVTPEEIKAYYQENQSLYQTPVTVSVSYIVLSPTDIAKNVTVTSDEAKQYYQSHLANFQVPARWDVAQITIPVASGASAADVNAAKAKADAIVPLFEKNKDTGFVSADVTLSAAEINQPLLTTLTQLKPNAVSAPLRTANGFTVLKLIKAMPAETHSFDSVKNTVMALLEHQRVNEILTKKSAQLADLTYTNPDSLVAASKALNLPIQVSPMLSKSVENKGLFADPKIMSAVFSDTVFKSNNNSNPIELADGSQVVVRVLKKNLSQLIPLDKVSAQIKQQLALKKASSQAGILAYELQKQLTKGVDPDSLAKKNSLVWHPVSLMSRDEKSAVPESIISAAFSEKPAHPQALLVNHQDYVVVVVNQVKNADSTQASAAQNQKLAEQLTTLWGQLFQRSFVDSVIANAKIVVKHPSQ